MILSPIATGFPIHARVVAEFADSARAKHRFVLWSVVIAGISRMQRITEGVGDARHLRLIHVAAFTIQRQTRLMVARLRRARCSPVMLRIRVFLCALAVVGRFARMLRKRRNAGKALLHVLRVVRRSPARQLVRRYQHRVKFAQRCARTHRTCTVNRLVALLLMWERSERRIVRKQDIQRLKMSDTVINEQEKLKFRRPPSVEAIQQSVREQMIMERMGLSPSAPTVRGASSPLCLSRKRGETARLGTASKVPGITPQPYSSASKSRSDSHTPPLASTQAGRVAVNFVRKPAARRVDDGEKGRTEFRSGVARLARAVRVRRSDEARPALGDAMLRVRHERTGKDMVIGFEGAGTPMHIRIRLARRYLAAVRHEHIQRVTEMIRNPSKVFAEIDTSITPNDVLCLVKHQHLPVICNKIVKRLFGHDAPSKRKAANPLLLFVRARRDISVLVEEGIRQTAVENRIEFQRLYAAEQLEINFRVKPLPAVLKRLDTDALAVPQRLQLDVRVCSNLEARQRLARRDGWTEAEKPAWTVDKVLQHRLGNVSRQEDSADQPHPASRRSEHLLDVEAVRRRHLTTIVEPMSSGVLAVLDSLVATCKEHRARQRIEARALRLRPFTMGNSTTSQPQQSAGTRASPMAAISRNHCDANNGSRTRFCSEAVPHSAPVQKRRASPQYSELWLQEPSHLRGTPFASSPDLRQGHRSLRDGMQTRRGDAGNIIGPALHAASTSLSGPRGSGGSPERRPVSCKSSSFAPTPAVLQREASRRGRRVLVAASLPNPRMRAATPAEDSPTRLSLLASGSRPRSRGITRQDLGWGAIRPLVAGQLLSDHLLPSD